MRTKSLRVYLIVYISTVLLISISLLEKRILHPTLAIIISAVLILVYKKRCGQKWKSLGLLKSGLTMRSLSIAFFLALILSFSFLCWVIPGIEYVTGQPLDFSLFEGLRGNGNLLLLAIPTAWVLAAFGEEFIFRGFFINGAREIFGLSGNLIWIPIVLSSVLFGFAHNYQGISGILITGLMGLILSFILIKRHFNLWVVILTHGFIDTLYFLIFYFNVDVLLVD